MLYAGLRKVISRCDIISCEGPCPGYLSPGWPLGTSVASRIRITNKTSLCLGYCVQNGTLVAALLRVCTISEGYWCCVNWELPSSSLFAPTITNTEMHFKIFDILYTEENFWVGSSVIVLYCIISFCICIV